MCDDEYLKFLNKFNGRNDNKRRIISMQLAGKTDSHELMQEERNVTQCNYEKTLAESITVRTDHFSMSTVKSDWQIP